MLDLAQDGVAVHRNIIGESSICALRRGMFEIMRPFLGAETASLGPDTGLDQAFFEVSARGGDLKSNCYRLFGKLSALPRLLAEPGLAELIKNFGFEDATIQSYSVFCLEHGNTRNTFLPHQDLRDRSSLDSLAIWIPLSAGTAIGGMACYLGSHHDGPLVHDVTDAGKPFLAADRYANCPRVEVTDFAVGDCVLSSIRPPA
jgi:hypothetical protein